MTTIASNISGYGRLYEELAAGIKNIFHEIYGRKGIQDVVRAADKDRLLDGFILVGCSNLHYVLDRVRADLAVSEGPVPTNGLNAAWRIRLVPLYISYEFMLRTTTNTRIGNPSDIAEPGEIRRSLEMIVTEDKNVETLNADINSDNIEEVMPTGGTILRGKAYKRTTPILNLIRAYVLERAKKDVAEAAKPILAFADQMESYK